MRIASKISRQFKRISSLFHRRAASTRRKKSQNGSGSRFWLWAATAIVVLPLALHAGQSGASLVQAVNSGSAPGLILDYIYGYAPVALEATRAIQTAVPDNTKQGQAPINQFAYQKTLSTPNDTLIVRPNADTLYTTAWLDLAAEPIILHVPDTAGRYYLIPMLDAYSNEFASVGSRTTGTSAGDYAIVGPLWQGPIPSPVTGVIHAPTDTVWMIGRTLVNGPADLRNAVAVATQYNLIPFSAYPEFLQTGSYTPPTNVPFTPINPDFFAFPVTNSQGFSEPKFFDVLSTYVAANPPSQEPLLASALVQDGFIHQNQLNSAVVSEANLAMDFELLATATKENGWSFHLNAGNYGTKYLLRAAIAKLGLGANLPADAVYMSADQDVSGAALTGTNSYVIHFAPGQTPPEQGFWSITAYGPDGFFVNNSINRYAVGSQTGLVKNADGSLDILLQNTQPQTMQSNWLPVPPTATDSDPSFNLTLRIFWPEQSVLDGTWTPPTLSRTEAPLP